MRYWRLSFLRRGHSFDELRLRAAAKHDGGIAFVEDLREDLQPFGLVRAGRALVFEARKAETRATIMVESEVHDSEGVRCRGHCINSILTVEPCPSRTEQGAAPRLQLRGAAPPMLNRASTSLSCIGGSEDSRASRKRHCRRAAAASLHGVQMQHSRAGQRTRSSPIPCTSPSSRL